MPASATAVAIPFEQHGNCQVALIALEGVLGKRFVHYSKTFGEEESWALRDYANNLILRSGASALTASDIEVEVTHAAKAKYRSVEQKPRWVHDSKEAAESEFGQNNVATTSPIGARDIGKWRKMTNRAS